ncbi:histone-lysine N-methyltransferase SETMAR [Trichonephila clavipes]|nr:histone-lysine N-methyltransferase SETMAR [Trichonephila clavipes]
MSSGNYLPQFNLSVQGGTQGVPTRVWWHYLSVEILTQAQRLMFHSDCVVSRRREGGHTSYRPLLNMQAMLWNGAKESLEDDARPGQAHRVITPKLIAEVIALVLDNRKITMDDIHRLLSISVTTTHIIIHQHLNFLKICAQRVPNHFTTEQHNTRMALSLSHLQRDHQEEYGFLSQIVTGDETWGHHFEPESKRQSKQWKRATSSPPKKSKVVCTPVLKVLQRPEQMIVRWYNIRDMCWLKEKNLKCDEEDGEIWIACDAEDCGFQLLIDDEIVTSVPEESDPVDDETGEDKDNNNDESSKGPSNADAFSALETTMEWYEQQLECCPTQLLLFKRIRDLAAKERRQINLEVDSDDVQELLDSLKSAADSG